MTSGFQRVLNERARIPYPSVYYPKTRAYNLIPPSPELDSSLGVYCQRVLCLCFVVHHSEFPAVLSAGTMTSPVSQWSYLYTFSYIATDWDLTNLNYSTARE